MKAFITYSTYTKIEEQTQVLLFGRLENGQSFASQHDFTPYFFIKESDLKKVKPLLAKFKTEQTNSTNFAKEKVIKITSTSHTDLNKLSTAVHKKEIDTYEADIKPDYRFLMDNDILGSIEIEGEFNTAERIDRHYINPEIKPAEFKPELKIISIDIESNKKTGEIFCIGIYGKDYKKNFLISKEKIENTINCTDEFDLLENFKTEIINIDPDIITGWHVIDFDLAYLKKKFEQNKIKFDLGRTNETSRIRIQSGFFQDSTADISGRQVLDGLNLIRDPFIKEAPTIKHANFDSYTLEDVSQELLKEGKILKGKKRHDEIEELYKKDNKKLVEYNLQDAKLAYDIITKTYIIDLAIERSTLTGMPLNRITASIASFDSLYIREARKKNLVSPTTRYSAREERITGGYVMKSETGIYENLLVLDFKSLYPSVMKTFNIDPASFIDSPKNKNNLIESPNKAYFINQEGILPKILEKLHNAREKAKKEKREFSSYAIKIIMNSFFGVLASPNCRYYSLKMGNAITHFAQTIIKLTAKKIDEMGHKVIYSDTDSVFVKTDLEKNKAEKAGIEIQNRINEFFKKHIKENYDRESFLELEFEKLYLSFMMPPTRGTKEASKKRYAGLLEKNGKEKIEVVGLEAIRGDWTEAAQEFQLELLDHIFHKKEFVKFIKEYVSKIEQGKMDKKLIYRKSIRKNLDEYTKTTPPHVKAARKLDKLESNLIQYYITEDGPEPIQKLKSKIDYKHYIEKQIKPIANTILFFFEKDFDEIIKSSKQMKLFDQ